VSKVVQQKVLITGGTGFIGKHLQSALTEREAEFFAFHQSQYDLTINDQVEAVFSEHRDAGVIIHMAGYQGAGTFTGDHPGELFATNSMIHLNVLEAWRRFAPQARFFAVGCSCGYPSDATTLVEDRYLEGKLHDSVYAYGFTKRLLYTGISAYNEQFGLNGNFVIPATLYGENDDFSLETAHVCGALVGKFVQAVREGIQEVEVWGDGTQVRDFLYVGDFVDTLVSLISLCERDILNVSPGKGTSIKELAETIRVASGFDGEVVYNTDRYVGDPHKTMDSQKLRNKYNLAVKGTLQEGIQRTVDWYAASYESIKDRRKFA
jgi:GDP-L-fucose synthase